MGRSNMEKITQNIHTLLDQSLGLYQNLIDVLEQEKEHILEMNLDGIWETTHKKNQLVKAITDDYNQLESNGFRGMATINALGLPQKEKSMLKTAVMSINTCKDTIARLTEKNKTYIMEYISMIDGIFSTLTQGPAHNQYGNSGGVIPSQEKKHFICAEV